MTRAFLLHALGWVTGAAALEAADYVPSNVRPPAPAREFRGAWVATVNNIDWPSPKTVSVSQQKAELTGILERAARLRLNAVILQVRPACDAVYASKLEPWSEYLTGQMGRAPKPWYDPLTFAVEEAHRRGLELHAWFNPFRARHSTGKSPVAGSHVSKAQPKLVRTYGSQLWLDPGEPGAQEHTLGVILDVVQRYDIDGVHFDDYFYPYPIRDAKGRGVDFPDGPSWDKYRARGGRMERGDWRRQNVDRFLQRLYQAIKAAKPHVKFGISPFGIWRPGYPPQIKGLDAFAELYADARKWLEEGWVDYFAPQLYWASDAREQSFPVLLKWWTEQNAAQRHVWPGISCYRHSAQELLNQVRLTRAQRGAGGNIHWSMKVLAQNRNGFADRLLKEAYAQPALVPACPWLAGTPPGKPTVTVEKSWRSALQLTWTPAAGEPVRLWLLQTKGSAGWTHEVLPARITSHTLSRAQPPEAVAVSAVDRAGNVSVPAVVERR